VKRVVQRWLLPVAAIVLSAAAACGGPNPAQLAATATAEAQLAETAVSMTATAAAAATRAAATATAATATGEAVRIAPTQTVIAAATEIAAIRAQATTVFAEDFVDNRNFWKLGAAGEFETTDLVDGTFQVTWSGKMSSSEFYELAEFRNFLAEAACRVIENPASGSCAVTFNWQSGIGYYRFELFEDYYRLFLQLQDQEPLILAEGRPQTAYLADTFNRITVWREGPRIRVFVNDILLADAEDSALIVGKVGISTASYSADKPVVVRFDGLMIATLGE
jgi:hypothetical protein